MSSQDCIVALASGRAVAALSLIRASGEGIFEIFKSMLQSEVQLEPNHSQFCRLYSQGEPIDEVVATYFKAPKSFTGEDMIEISCHGNPLIVERIIEEFVSRGTRIAEAGEFSRRAYKNNKMSLWDLEALDLLMSSSQVEGVRWAIRSKLEASGLRLQDFRNRLSEVLSQVEAELDFPEHEVDQGTRDGLTKAIEAMALELESWAISFEKSRSHFFSPKVAILGPPNVGKSSLFNCLLGQERAIVYNLAGTTRDLLEAQLRLGGLDLCLVDTAGLRESSDPLERLGMQKSLEVLKAADLVLWLSDQAEPAPQSYRELAKDSKWLFLATKSDLRAREQRKEAWIYISSQTGEGIEKLKKELLSWQKGRPDFEGSLHLSSDRQCQLVREAQSLLSEALDLAAGSAELEWLAQKLREANQRLEPLIGKIGHEEILGRILSRFCIGK
ncbi:MAG: tRNA uridine-5-carboxymethylaminomethyl(34) synthesis GTPase MnmE [Bradymonadales bacterium]|nr:MAG: tRNA uridine-5-carboxymethylaminomethyl(34) synthesis GTPase MnmE [Bradymonadales bacterium]